MAAPEPLDKLCITQIIPLQAWLLAYKSTNKTTLTAMSKHCSLGKAAVSSIVAIPTGGCESCRIDPRRSPTWRLVRRLVEGLGGDLEEVIPRSLWHTHNVEPPQESQVFAQPDDGEKPKSRVPYSLTEVGVFSSEKMKVSQLYTLEVSMDVKRESHIMIIQGAISEALVNFRRKDFLAMENNFAGAIIMIAGLCSDMGYDLEQDVSLEIDRLRGSVVSQ